MRSLRSGRLGVLATMVGVVAFIPLGLPTPIAAHSSVGAATIRSFDLGLETGFQDTQFGHFQRGRALVPADFDLDGRVDFYVGNPGDQSYVLRNVSDGGGAFHFEIVQTLLTTLTAWGAVSLDYDNDGDYDIFVTIGGNEGFAGTGEGIGFNHLFRNMWMESGQASLSFQDVTDQAGVAGPIPPGSSDPIPIAGAGAVAGDYDRDGWTDVFENVNINNDSLPDLKGRNILWHNDGDGTFTDVTDQVGLGVTHLSTRHSTLFDIDNDGDLDLYENNWLEPNHLWRNRLVEDGTATFEDVTQLFSPPGEDLSRPYQSFATTAADFDNDGWEDLLVAMRFHDPYTDADSPYPVGHVLFINVGGRGFVNLAESSGINRGFVWKKGVMGCQLGDVNSDGGPDVYVGNGAPMDSTSTEGGQYDRLYVSAQLPGRLPRFRNMTSLIDYPAPESGTLTYPSYPYRTHGTAIVDVDGDGTQEIAVTNGGPAHAPDYMREPDRLFKLVPDRPANWFIVRAVGDGASVGTDAIGTRFALTVQNAAGKVWTIHRTLFGGSCFSAQNGFEVHFGLANADTILSLEIDWPDGVVETRTTGLDVNSRLLVSRSDMRGATSDHPRNASMETTDQVASLLAAHPRLSRSRFPLYPSQSDPRLQCDWG